MDKALNEFLDAAILKPETTREEMVEATCHCVGLEVFSVCVRPCDIGVAREMCGGTATKVCVVLGFPHGCQLSASKADEAARYIDLGVDEIDMVANYGWAKSGLWDEVAADIAAVAGKTRPSGTVLKVIFETAQLGPGEIERLVEASIAGGADFVKTSTGFNGEGAREDDVRLMLRVADGRIRVKPSGGIRDAERARLFVDMGVHRLGVNWSSCEAICGGVSGAKSAGAADGAY